MFLIGFPEQKRLIRLITASVDLGKVTREGNCKNNNFQPQEKQFASIISCLVGFSKSPVTFEACCASSTIQEEKIELTKKRVIRIFSIPRHFLDEKMTV